MLLHISILIIIPQPPNLLSSSGWIWKCSRSQAQVSLKLFTQRLEVGGPWAAALVPTSCCLRHCTPGTTFAEAPMPPLVPVSTPTALCGVRTPYPCVRNVPKATRLAQEAAGILRLALDGRHPCGRQSPSSQAPPSPTSGYTSSINQLTHSQSQTMGLPQLHYNFREIFSENDT